MSRIHASVLIPLLLLVFAAPAFGQRYDLQQVVAHKWKVIWYADDGVEHNMEAKKQQLIMKSDGSGQMFMLGEKIGDVVWSVTGKNTINFQDDPLSAPYSVKVSKYKKGKNMLFTGTMPTGVVRKVYFEILSGK